jgi:sugar-specific transcriptional regulator TrmB
MYQPFLQNLGLSENEAKIYELLLTNGKGKARDLVEHSGLGRANVYALLGALVQKGLVTVSEGTQQIFQITEPTHLEKLMNAKIQATERLQNDFRQELPKLLSTFNLTTRKPAVRVFEGIDGLKEAIADSLEAKNGICTYLDVSGLTGIFAEANAAYVKQRVSRGVLKRIIVADTPESHEFFSRQGLRFTDVAFVPQFPSGTKTAMEIYNDTVSFITMDRDIGIAVLMTDPYIAAMQKAQFEFLWDQYFR